MNTFAELFESYSGHDSIIRAVNYVCFYLSGRTSGDTSLKFKKISEQLSYCRMILRLFDDLPMLRYTIMYGLGKEESSLLLRCLGVLKNIVNQVYYPVEHLAWAADMKLIKAKSETFSVISCGLWALSSYINIIRSLIVMSHLQKQTYGLKNTTEHKNSEGEKQKQATTSHSSTEDEPENIYAHNKGMFISIHAAIVKEQLELLLFAFKNVADVVIAINYFPTGSLLWAGKLDTRQIGLCGIISSFLHILMLVKDIKKSERNSIK